MNASEPRDATLSPKELGVLGGQQLAGSLRYERPAYVFGHRLKDCQVGAFTYFNAAGVTSAYRTRFGRYVQVGESAIIAPPEHPWDWFSSHPFTFTRPQFMPNMYQMPEFARLAPDADAGPSWAESQNNVTVIGHDVWIGAGSFIRRGLTIGDGAIIGANAVVTRDVPPYAIVVGSPARLLRLRFDEKIVERFLALQWWRYDLAPFKTAMDFSQVEATLDFLEARVADGRLQELRPDTYELRGGPQGLKPAPLDAPLFFA